MPSVWVRYCCCGCSLRTGTIAIGYFCAVIGVIISLAATTALGFLNYRTPEELGINSRETPLMMIAIVGLATSLIQTTVSVCLVYGGMQEKVSFLAPWIIYTVIRAVLPTLSVFGSILRRQTWNLDFIPWDMQVTQAALFIYFLLVVCSYRTSLLQRTERKVALVEHYKFSLP